MPSQAIPYSGGDEIGAIVGEFGNYTTKMGFAGEDFPRALFRSDVAILRSNSDIDNDNSMEVENSAQEKGSNDMSTSPTKTTSSPTKRKIRKRGNITSIHYDLSKPLNPSEGNDGDWETYNPIDAVSGLLRVTPESSTSQEKDVESQITQETPIFTHMLQHGAKSSMYSSDALSTSPFLFIEKSYNTPRHRQTVTEILFEQFSSPAVFIGKDAVLSCFACGRTTSTVVDVGALGTTISPVFDGFVEQKGIMRSPVGGRAFDVTMLSILDSLYCNTTRKHEIMPFYQVHSKLLTKPIRSMEFHKLARLDMARQCKEIIATTATTSQGYDPSNLDPSLLNMITSPMELPDGTVLNIGHERYALSEILFGKHEYAIQKRQEFVNNAPVSSNDDSKAESSGVIEEGLAALASQSPRFLNNADLSSNAVQNLVVDSVFKCDREQQVRFKHFYLIKLTICLGSIIR